MRGKEVQPGLHLPPGGRQQGPQDGRLWKMGIHEEAGVREEAGHGCTCPPIHDGRRLHSGGESGRGEGASSAPPTSRPAAGMAASADRFQLSQAKLS